MKHAAAVAGLLLVTAGCGSRGAGGGGLAPYRQQVLSYLANQESAARGQGYTRPVDNPALGVLNDDGRASHEMTVANGVSYILFGACDNDCSDLDLRIFDTNGNVLMQDLALDDTPTLRFAATGSGKYRVEAIMATCRRNPCVYGIRLMAR